MQQRIRFHWLPVLPCLAFSLLAQTPAPPAEAAPQVIQIAAHESRWDYPKQVTLAPNTQLHMVAKGDTLWDLGAKYLGNPFAWPQIWELNKWVTDPHWIFPGDALVVDATRTVLPQPGVKAAAMAPDEVAELQPDVKRPAKRSRDEYSYSIHDFLQIPFIAEQGAERYAKKTGALQIVGKQDAGKDLQGDGDIVYLNGGADHGLKVGDRLVTFAVQKRKFYHPDDVHRRKAMGDILQQSGILRVTHTYPRESVAIIEKSMDSLLVGNYAATFVEPVNLVANLRTDIADPVEVKVNPAKIVFVQSDKVLAGAGDLVIIDHGSNAGLKVGDDLLIARTRQLDPTRKATAKDIMYTFVGQLLVVRTEEKTASCRILRNKTEVQVGDIITP